MKVFVFADTHGKIERVMEILQKESPHCVLHLGDHSRDAHNLQNAFPHIMFHIVNGNNDFNYNFPDEKVVELEGKRLLLAHGHQYHINSTLSLLTASAKEQHCDAALFGHSHVAKIDGIDGVFLLNPGSITLPHHGAKPSYAVLSLGETVSAQLVYI